MNRHLQAQHSPKTYPVKPSYEGINLNNIFDSFFHIFHNGLLNDWFFEPLDSLDRYNIPTYPVTNYSVKDDGTSIIELALTGFNKGDISVDIEGDRLLIGATTPKDETDRKYVYKKIATRDIHVEYKCSNKMDLEKTKVSYVNGLLSIEIPMKDEMKPIKKQLEITTSEDSP